MSDAFQEMKRFGDQHSLGTRLLRVAAHDYAAARCLLFNGMFEGLVLGTQAIEKCLKAYLMFADPTRAVYKLKHSLPKLLKEANEAFPQLPLNQFEPLLVTKFSAHYQARYPDNQDASTTKTTADLRELDEFVVFLNENMPCPRNVKYLAGIYPFIGSAFAQRTVSTWETWIKRDNLALLPLLPRINVEYAEVQKALYPKPRT